MQKMDIHRCSFVPFPPQTLSALAFSHSSNTSEPTPPDLRLAVGREGSGEVEIWNPLGGKWVQESILRGSEGHPVEQLAWTQDVEIEERSDNTLYNRGPLRLFSIGGSTSITEWDLENGRPKKLAEGNYGDIWCFAAQPSLDPNVDGDGPLSSQALVAGCSDGSIILFSTDENDLRFSRVVQAKPGKGLKVLSMTWRNRDTIVAGYENGEIRVVHVPTRRILRTMTLGKPAEGTKAVVWTVKCLADGTILSGDSAGELKIWDAKTLSLVQRLHTHQADILDIAFNSKGDQMFTVGVDRRTVAYKLITTAGVKSDRWAEASHRRFHRNDVKSIDTYESRDMGVVVTGGVDAALVINSLRDGHKSLHRTLPHLPHQPPVSSTRRARLLISWWQQNVHVYHIPKRTQFGQSTGSSNYSLLATLQLKGDEHVQSASISEDGHFVLASTSSGVRLFQLRLSHSHGNPTLRSRLVGLPASLNRFGARLVGISPDSKWLYAIRPDNTIVVCKLLPSSSTKSKPAIHPSITKLVPTSTPSSLTLGLYPSTISTATFSHDSRVLAVGTVSGVITTWVLSGHEDSTPLSPPKPASNHNSDTSMSSSDSDSDSDSDDESETPTIHNQRWTLTPASTATPYPSLGSPVLVLTFRPPPDSSSASSPSHTNGNIGLHATRQTPHPISHEHPEPAPQLIAISAEHKLVEFNIYTGKLTAWSRRNQRLPPKFMQVRDRVRACFWDTATDQTARADEEKQSPRRQGRDTERQRQRQRQRLWLYGSMFLTMFNVSEDIGEDSRDGAHQDGQENNSNKTWSTFIYRDILGAGVIGCGQDELERASNAISGDNGDDDDDDVHMNGTGPTPDDVEAGKKQQQQQMEVVIIERPMWDVRQPPRYDGGQDWES